ncbi:MAG: hypothetical protein ACKVHL_12570, partial [Rhodospirillales bacterium]
MFGRPEDVAAKEQLQEKTVSRISSLFIIISILYHMRRVLRKRQKRVQFVDEKRVVWGYEWLHVRGGESKRHP